MPKANRPLMKLFPFIVTILFFISCDTKNKKVNPYENKLNISPSLLAHIDTAHYTEIVWEDSVQDFGRAREGDTLKINFRFKNTGKTPLFLTEARANCGCTVADYPQNIIYPGEGGVLTARFETSGKSGLVKKSVIVGSNTKNSIFHTLVFYGEVKNK